MIPADQLVPLQYDSYGAALDGFSDLVRQLFELLDAEAFDTTPHPMYGPLNRDDTITFHYKHLQHHLSQFGLIPINYSAD